MISKKREAWDSICQQYNAVAVSGLRKWQQLRHLYENLKQRSKKHIAQVNRIQFYDKTKNGKDDNDKNEINHTGGGSYGSTLPQYDPQIFAMVSPQIQPLPNPYDDAVMYFERVKPKLKDPNIKEQYLKAKLRNAKLENKFLINKNRMEINKYKIEMQILKLRLKKLQSS